MIEKRGKYNTAKIFTNNIEESALSQIIELCNQKFTENSQIRIMSDVHAGAGVCIGTTMTVQDKVVPNIVGVDLGCGVSVLKLKEKDVDFVKLDNIIREFIPSGFSVRKSEHAFSKMIDLSALRCAKFINTDRAKVSIGTLGGGNHYIEGGKDEEGNIYLSIHSGSRNLGKQIAEHYQELGYDTLMNNRKQIQVIIDKCKAEGREADIENLIKNIKQEKFPKALAWVEGENMKDYLHDVNIAQKFAVLNRKAIMHEIVTRMDLHKSDIEFDTIHNYIETETMILRKGAVSAKDGEMLVIPMNMEDGSLICIGKGNPDWNYSAPHGAGRIMSRGEAKEKIKLEDYEKSMEGIYTTSVCMGTIDECAMAYKPMDEIIDNIKDTVDIIKIIKPVHNFKDSPIKDTAKAAEKH